MLRTSPFVYVRQLSVKTIGGYVFRSWLAEYTDYSGAIDHPHRDPIKFQTPEEADALDYKRMEAGDWLVGNIRRRTIMVIDDATPASPANWPKWLRYKGTWPWENK